MRPRARFERRRCRSDRRETRPRGDTEICSHKPIFAVRPRRRANAGFRKIKAATAHRSRAACPPSGADARPPRLFCSFGTKGAFGSFLNLQHSRRATRLLDDALVIDRANASEKKKHKNTTNARASLADPPQVPARGYRRARSGQCTTKRCATQHPPRERERPRGTTTRRR